MTQITKVLTLIVFGLLFLNLSAQDGFENDKVAKLPDEDRKVRFGLHFTPNISWLKTNNAGYESGGSKIGFSYGVAFDYYLTNNYLISSGIGVLNTGGIINRPTLFHPVEEDFKLKYIEIPALLKLRTNEIGYLTYYGQFGIMTGFNISSKSDLEFNRPSLVSASDVVEPMGINFINMSLAIGVGVEYNISGNTGLNVGVTFYNGFVDQMDGDASANLNYLALNLGVYF
jgi:hypothetical protein